MENNNQTPRKSGSRNPLNVSAQNEKIEETRARIRGDSRTPGKSPIESPKLRPSSGSSDEMEEIDLVIEDASGSGDSAEIVGRERPEGNSCEKLQEELGESNRVSSCLSTESDTLLGLSENVEWVRRNFKRPLALAMRDVLARKPCDPVHFVALWLLNYRGAQENLRLRQERDRELVEERAKIQQFLSVSSSKIDDRTDLETAEWAEETSEDDEGIPDPNYKDYFE